MNSNPGPAIIGSNGEEIETEAHAALREKVKERKDTLIYCGEKYLIHTKNTKGQVSAFEPFDIMAIALDGIRAFPRSIVPDDVFNKAIDNMLMEIEKLKRTKEDAHDTDKGPEAGRLEEDGGVGGTPADSGPTPRVEPERQAVHTVSKGKKPSSDTGK